MGNTRTAEVRLFGVQCTNVSRNMSSDDLTVSQGNGPGMLRATINVLWFMLTSR